MTNPWYDLKVDLNFDWSTDIARTLYDESFLVLKGAYQISDNLPSTPKTPEDHLDNLALQDAARSLRAIAENLGTPFINKGMKQEKYFVQQVFPVKGRENSDSAASSKKELDLHSEHAMFERMPDYILITCLKNPDYVPTLISPFNERDIDEEDILTLSKAFGSDDLENWDKAVLSRDQNGRLSLRFDSIFQKFDDKNEQVAFSRLVNSLRNNVKSVILEPGDVCIIDNKRCVHGRAQFQPRFDGSDRWMMRTMVSKHLFDMAI